MDADKDSDSLHEFLSTNRDELLDMAVEKLKAHAPTESDQDLRAGLPEVFDEIVRSMRLRDGMPDPPARPTEAAAAVGRQRQRMRDTIGLTALGIGAISDALGELGARKGDRTFAAREYQFFNQALDVAVAAAIEEYASRERAARRLEESKRVGFIAHEMRNALSTAELAYQHLKRGGVGILSHTGEVLGRGLHTAETLVRQMMATVQLEAGAPIERRPVSVSQLFQQLVAAHASDRGISVRCQTDGELALLGDERLVSSAIGNLLQNALKFTRDGGVVTLRAQKSGDTVVVEVEDECGGLPAGAEQTMFDPFVQGAADRRGLGLGLAITREATEAQGGNLSVRNLPGKGCVFALRLPVARDGAS
jgi:signal transduction histidine kinase